MHKGQCMYLGRQGISLQLTLSTQVSNGYFDSKICLDLTCFLCLEQKRMWHSKTNSASFATSLVYHILDLDGRYIYSSNIEEVVEYSFSVIYFIFSLVWTVQLEYGCPVQT